MSAAGGGGVGAGVDRNERAGRRYERTSADGAAALAGIATAREFVSDAYTHCKFIGYAGPAVSLLDKAGLPLDEEDEGLVPLEGGDAAAAFLAACRKLRHWAREDRP